MEESIFKDPASRPDEHALKVTLDGAYDDWMQILETVFRDFVGAKEEWNFSKAGWNMRLKDKKRAIVYLTPGAGRFRVSMVFGEKATNLARTSSLSATVLQTIEDAPVYGEGRGFRIMVPAQCGIEDIIKLIEIKKRF